VRLIDENGQQLGIKPIGEALNLAEEKGLDLVEIAPMAKPPVCKIISFSKYKYEQERKLRQEHKKQKIGQIKEIRFRPRINEHDLETKIRHAREFLTDKYKLKVIIMLLGREMGHSELGYNLANKIKERLADISIVEQEPKSEGNRIIMLFSSKIK